jgi:hypothetical protein
MSEQQDSGLRTIDEWYREAFEVAVGWLGWTEEQALHADINTIVIAANARLEMMQMQAVMIAAAMRGQLITSPTPAAGAPAAARRPPPPKAGEKRDLSPAIFDASFGPGARQSPQARAVTRDYFKRRR